MHILEVNVAGKWTPVLTNPDDCPTPINIVIGKTSFSGRKEWIRQYVEANCLGEKDEVDFRFRPI